MKITKLLCVLIILFLVGCGNDTLSKEESLNEDIKIEVEENKEQVNDIPEPYERAISAINSKDFEMANSYLDLVISDFPDNEYVFSAYTLKGSLHISSYLAISELFATYARALENESVFYDEEDLMLIEDQLDFIQEIYNQSLEDFEETLYSIVEYFDSTRDYSAHFGDIDPISVNNNYYDDLSFFADIGYPVPTNAEVDEYLNDIYNLYAAEFLGDLTGEHENYNYIYLPLFYYGARAMVEHDTGMLDELHDIISDLTTEDPYNEYRIRLEELITELHDSQENPEIPIKNENSQVVKDDAKNSVVEWAPGVKEEFENIMVQRGYVDSEDDIFYRNEYVGDEGDVFYEAWTVLEDGEEWYIVTVNVKTGWFHG